MEILEKFGAHVSYNDPFIPEIRSSREFSKYAGKTSVEISSEYDVFLILTAHSVYKEIDFFKFNIPIVDTRNILKIKNPLINQA
jgi:UDP-N-acetyl-D-glucosamine dehydrogenase